MRSLYALLIPIALLLLTSCEKELSYEGGYIPPTHPPVEPPVELTDEEKFRALLAEDSFQLRAFYSNIPVDYNENDAEIKQETDLWQYVAPYLKDDVNIFPADGNELTIRQNEKKKPGLPDPSVTRPFDTGTDENGVYMIFLDYQYNPLQYHVHEFGADYFILSIEGPQGSTLFSRFEKLL